MRLRAYGSFEYIDQWRTIASGVKILYATYMIASPHRFHGYGSLNHTYRRGKTVRGQWFALRFLDNPRRSGYRAAVVVSRKVHKSAVVRNRVRRRLYALIRQELGPQTPAVDLIFTVFTDRVATAPSEELRRMLVELLRAANLR